MATAIRYVCRACGAHQREPGPCGVCGGETRAVEVTVSDAAPDHPDPSDRG